jgi:hypothetical protein
MTLCVYGTVLTPTLKLELREANSGSMRKVGTRENIPGKKGVENMRKGQADTDDAAQKTTVNIKRHGNASII